MGSISQPNSRKIQFLTTVAAQQTTWPGTFMENVNRAFRIRQELYWMAGEQSASPQKWLRLHEVSEIKSCAFLGAFAKLRKVTINSVCPSAWNTSAPTGGDFHGIWYLSVFRKSVGESQASLQYDKHNGYFTWRPKYIFDHISLNFS
jgi:hypothetical protein